MIFPNKKNHTTKIVSLLLALLLLVGITTPSAAAATSTKPTTTTVATIKIPAGTTKVAYGASKYPNLTSIDYGTYRKLDYKEKSTQYTYFYDFRTTWYSGASITAPEKGPYTNQPGLYGVLASTDGTNLTVSTYSEIANAKVKYAKLYTYDGAQAINLSVPNNGTMTASTAKLANGPYTLSVWFDYTANGTTKPIGVARVLYISNGKGYFAERAFKDNDYAMQSWLADNRNTLAADDVFQAWVAKQGGNDLAKATSLAGVCYPFKSGTTRYPNDTSKWQQLAHQICSDANAGDYAKAAALYDWMVSNLAYDNDQLPYDGNNGDYRWAIAAATGTATGYTTWDSRIGKCEDFANIYTIMARELGIPAHVMTDTGHAWSIVYIRGHWEVVDPTSEILGNHSAYLGTDNKTFIANAKAFWATQKTGADYKTTWHGFMDSTNNAFDIASYEKSKYATVEAKFADSNYFDRLNTFLHNAQYYNDETGTIYGH